MLLTAQCNVRRAVMPPKQLMLVIGRGSINYWWHFDFQSNHGVQQCILHKKLGNPVIDGGIMYARSAFAGPIMSLAALALHNTPNCHAPSSLKMLIRGRRCNISVLRYAQLMIDGDSACSISCCSSMTNNKISRLSRCLLHMFAWLYMHLYTLARWKRHA